MHRVRISDISMGHYLKLFGRSAMFLASLSLYITGRLAEELIRDFTAAMEELAENGAEAAYGDQVYDRALYKAILRAEEYLEPFFKYKTTA